MTSSSRSILEEIGCATDEIDEALGISTTVVPEVDDSVDSIATSREEAISLAEKDLNFLAALCIPTVFRFLFPPIYLLAWDMLTKAAFRSREFLHFAIGFPRGKGKTTFIKIYVLFLILFTKRKFVVIISATATLAENVLSDIVDMLDESNILALFGNWRSTLSIDRGEQKKFEFKGRPIILAAIGVGGSIRGLNIKNERPDAMIFEDAQTKENADSEALSTALEVWMVGTAMKAKSPFGCIFLWIGNKYPTKFSILRKLQDNPRWTKFISGAILQDGTSIWPELQSVEQLMEELENDIAMGHPEIFFAEVLNDDLTAFSTRLDFSRIRHCPWTLEMEAENPPQGKCIIIDPAGDKKDSDLVAIGLFYIYDETPVGMKVVEDRFSPGETIYKALEIAFETNTCVICVESNAYQFSLLYWFDFICQQIGISGIHFVEIYSGSIAKNTRIANMIKELNAGEVLLSSAIRSVVLSQVLQWNPMKRDNKDGILDLLTYARRCMDLYGHLMEISSQLINQEYESARVLEVEENCAF